MEDGNGDGIEVPRVLGRLDAARPGPRLVVVAGIHGNEPAGVHALRRVLAALERSPRPLSGDLLALSGNRGALARGERYLGRDLNRGWGEAGASGGPSGSPEDREQAELWREIAAAESGARGPLYLLDLHSTSAPGIPFLMSAQDAASRAFARAVPLPAILGLLDSVEGTLLRFLARRGAAVLGVEGGQNQDPRSVDHHEAVLWLALVASGVLAAADAPEVYGAHALLDAARRGLPRATEVSYRHRIAPQDGFEMCPGFANLQRIRRGELLARDRGGEIRAAEDGMLLLPLYQARGEEGFFLGREVAL
jgi:succinylglutamate desuccinylase